MKFPNASFVFLVLTIIFAMGESQAAFRIKYISSEFVYLDAGSADSLMIGDKLTIMRKQVRIADLEVAFTAQHSASCKILLSQAKIIAGDQAIVTAKAEQVEIKPDTTSMEMPFATEIIEEAQVKKERRSPSAIMSGSIAVQYYHFDDQSESNMDFSQPSSRLNFRVRQLWGKEITFKVRARTYRNERTRVYRSTVPQDEWKNRIYELSISYGNKELPMNFKAGRIVVNEVSGAGFIDGLLIQKKLSNPFSGGVFAGTQPEWRNSKFQTSGRKFGGYLLYDWDKGGWRYEGAVAGVGEYHYATISREYLCFQNEYSHQSKWGVFQSAEIDINRNWRRDRAGETIKLSNLYISARYRLSSNILTAVSFDNRRNYWTYDTQTLADSLFDDAMRQGLQTNLSLRLPWDLAVYGRYGYNKRETESDATHSYSISLSKNNLILKGLRASFQYSAFSSLITDGHHWAANLGGYLTKNGYSSVEYGSYAYEYQVDATDRQYFWLRLDSQMEVYNRIYLQGQYEYDWGDVYSGKKVLMEIGYRF